MWVDQYGDSLFHFALARVKNKDIAEDLVQENKEFLDHFYRCLSDVPQRSADAFVYREIDGLSTEEICTRLDITANNCWVLLYRARMLLRKCLELIGLGRQQEGNLR